MIRLQGVKKTFGRCVALDETDLTIAAEQTTVLIGPSGCGKSTLLRLILGLVSPDAGTVEVAGTMVTRDNGLALRREMGYVIQDGGLFPHLTAEKNVTLMADYLGWSRPKARQRLDELTALTRFPTSGLSRYPSQLSGGQRQRVSLMRALMLDPRVLLLDEPLGSLDPIVRAELQADLKQVFQSLGKTVVFVTHDMGEAAYLGDSIVMFRQGSIVQHGTLRDLLHRPADDFVRQFIRIQRSQFDALQEGDR